MNFGTHFLEISENKKIINNLEYCKKNDENMKCLKCDAKKLFYITFL